jgi:hypothetical protein
MRRGAYDGVLNWVESDGGSRYLYHLNAQTFPDLSYIPTKFQRWRVRHDDPLVTGMKGRIESLSREGHLLHPNRVNYWHTKIAVLVV